MEDQYVETAYIAEAFPKTDYDKVYIHINMEGAMVNLLKDIDPTYCKKFIYIDSHEKNSCMQNPRMLYTAIYRHH